MAINGAINSIRSRPGFPEMDRILPPAAREVRGIPASFADTVRKPWLVGFCDGLELTGPCSTARLRYYTSAVEFLFRQRVDGSNA